MLRTKKGRTGGRVNHYMPPFGGHKNVLKDSMIYFGLIHEKIKKVL